MLVVFKYSFCSRKFSRCCVHLRQKRALPGSGRTRFLGVKWMGVATRIMEIFFIYELYF